LKKFLPVYIKPSSKKRKPPHVYKISRKKDKLLKKLLQATNNNFSGNIVEQFLADPINNITQTNVSNTPSVSVGNVAQQEPQNSVPSRLPGDLFKSMPRSKKPEINVGKQLLAQMQKVTRYNNDFERKKIARSRWGK